MKNTLPKLLLLLLIIFVSCEGNNFNTNDSVGNDTFSCYINGDLYIPSAGTSINGVDIQPFTWTHDANNNLFSIYTRGNYRIRITNLNTQIGENTLDEELGDIFDFSHSGMIIQNQIIYYKTINENNNGKITFTKYNEKEAKGMFECILYNNEGKELKVTNGKFNLSLDSRTN